MAIGYLNTPLDFGHFVIILEVPIVRIFIVLIKFHKYAGSKHNYCPQGPCLKVAEFPKLALKHGILLNLPI